jgi:hypothetical protein
MVSRLECRASGQYADSRKGPTNGGDVSDKDKETTANEKPDYEAPKVEEVVTATDLEREVQYAGTSSRVAV